MVDTWLERVLKLDISGIFVYCFTISFYEDITNISLSRHGFSLISCDLDSPAASVGRKITKKIAINDRF